MTEISDTLRLPVLLLMATLLIACDSKQSTPPITESASPQHTPEPAEHAQGQLDPGAEQKQNILVAERFEALSRDALAEADALSKAVQDFLQKPSTDTLEVARRLWTQAHDAYLLAATAELLEIYHPVLDLAQTEPTVIHPLRIRIDQFPMIPGYLDTVAGYPNSGLIHSELPINFETLNAEHQFSDSAYLTMGFHALEFMLNGDPGILDPRHEAYRLTHDDQSTNQKTIQRRRDYLQFLVRQLREDVQLLADAWTGPEGFYRSYVTVLQTRDLQAALANARQRAENDQQTGHIPSEVATMRRQLLTELADFEAEPAASSAPVVPDK